jgi:TFIIF-interacting CTD phosphatase-like protein
MNSSQLKRLNIPFKSKHPNYKTVVLDLDETLVHCDSSGDVLVQIKNQYGTASKVFFNIRPNCDSFLKELSALCEVILFTSSNRNYAEAVIIYNIYIR